MKECKCGKRHYQSGPKCVDCLDAAMRNVAWVEHPRESSIITKEVAGGRTSRAKVYRDKMHKGKTNGVK